MINVVESPSPSHWVTTKCTLSKRNVLYGRWRRRRRVSKLATGSLPFFRTGHPWTLNHDGAEGIRLVFTTNTIDVQKRGVKAFLRTTASDYWAESCFYLKNEQFIRTIFICLPFVYEIIFIFFYQLLIAHKICSFLFFLFIITMSTLLHHVKRDIWHFCFFQLIICDTLHIIKLFLSRSL